MRAFSAIIFAASCLLALTNVAGATAIDCDSDRSIGPDICDATYYPLLSQSFAVNNFQPLRQPDQLVTFDFVGVTFADGATATGSFTADLTNSTIASATITVSGGSAFPGINQSYDSNPKILNSLYILFYGSTNSNILIDLQLDAALNPNSNDPISLQYAGYGIICNIHGCGTDDVTGGAVDPGAVPEPASLMLLGSALLGFGAFRWRGRHRSQTT